MRRSLLILGALGCACTASVAEEELELMEAEAEYASLRIVPDARADLEVGPPLIDSEANHPAAVRVEVSRFRFDEDPQWADGTALCPFDVRAVGLPAIRGDGGAIADLHSETFGPSDGEDELVTFSMLDVETRETSRTDTLVEGVYDRNKYTCWRWYKRAKAQAAELNEMLADGWRPMRELPVEVDPRLGPGGEDGEFAERRPASQRPVQLTLLGGQVVFRVPGVKVLSRTDDDWLRPVDDDPHMGMCQYGGPEPWRVLVDASTGVAMISMSFQAGSCMCDTPVGHEIIHLDADTIAEIDRRGAIAGDES